MAIMYFLCMFFMCFFLLHMAPGKVNLPFLNLYRAERAGPYLFLWFTPSSSIVFLIFSLFFSVFNAQPKYISKGLLFDFIACILVFALLRQGCIGHI